MDSLNFIFVSYHEIAEPEEKEWNVANPRLSGNQGHSLAILLGEDLKLGALLHNFGALLQKQHPSDV